MWKIRPEQAESLRQAGMKEFEDSLVKHLQGFIPKLAAVLGEDGLREVIRYGWERAAGHGWTSGGSIRFDIEMVFLFGAEFDTDPQYPWAGQILNDKETGPQERADRLHVKAMEFLDKVSGPQRNYVKAALRRARQEPFAGPARD